MNLLYRAGLILYFACLLPPASAQLNDRSVSPPPAADGRLLLDVVVTDHSGKPMPGLEEKDFSVFDNGHDQKILSFRANGTGAVPAGSQPAEPAEPPVKIILLVDEVNSNFRRVAYERDQIKQFLQKNGGVLKHPLSMAFFTDKGTQLQNDSSTDGNALLAVFDAHETALRSIQRSTGVYGAIERLQLSMNALQAVAHAEANQPGRKLVVWISAGWPLLSGPGIELTSKEQTNLFSSIVSISTALRQARVTLSSVNPEGAGGAELQDFYYQTFLKPVTRARDTQVGNLALQVIATQSGGLALTASNDIAGQIARCVADADSYYTLVVDQAPADAPNSYHALTVKVAKPGLTARTRAGYYIQP